MHLLVYFMIVYRVQTSYWFSVLTLVISVIYYPNWFKLSWGDPGYVQKSNVGVTCETCSAVKNEGTHHCRKCGRCVAIMDHHCLWIDNCVAAWNFKYYFRVMILVSIQFSVSCVYFFSKIVSTDIEPKGIYSLKCFVPLAPLWFSEINLFWYLFDAFILLNSIFYGLYPFGSALKVH